jgi:CDGSH-type Zn-finger protein
MGLRVMTPGETTPYVAAKNDVRLTAYRDGPLLVRAPDAGEPVEAGVRRAVALCRCGRSRLWPTCDGTHQLVGFRAPAADLTLPESD